MQFEHTKHWYVHKTSQNVLDHGNNYVTITIACSNLSN